MSWRTILCGLAAAGTAAVARADDAPPSAFDRPARPFAYEFTVGHLAWKTSGPFTGITKSFRPNPIPYRIELAAAGVTHPVPLRASFWKNFDRFIITFTSFGVKESSGSD